jgi:type I restriction enzyme S subunit
VVENVRSSLQPLKHEVYELWSVPSYESGKPEILQGDKIGSSKLQVQPGDLLISKINPRINRVWQVQSSVEKYEQICSPEWLVLRANDDKLVDVTFLKFLAQSPDFRAWITSNVSGVTGSHTRAKADHILKYQFVLPPLDEQKRIVEILEEQLSRLDAGAAGLTIADARSRSFLSSTIQSQFETVELSKQPLKSVADVQGGMTPKGLEAWLSDNPAANRCIPFYKVSDMNREEVFMSEAKVYLSESDVSTLRVKLLTPGAVIFPKAGGAIATNKKRIVKVSGGVDLNCMSVTAREQLLPEYLYWWFQGLDLRTISDGSILPQISKSSVEALEIPCPSIPEQERIVEECTKARDATSRVQAAISASKMRGDSLRRSVLHAAFTGQLTKEPANV